MKRAISILVVSVTLNVAMSGFLFFNSNPEPEEVLNCDLLHDKDITICNALKSGEWSHIDAYGGGTILIEGKRAVHTKLQPSQTKLVAGLTWQNFRLLVGEVPRDISSSIFAHVSDRNLLATSDAGLRCSVTKGKGNVAVDKTCRWIDAKKSGCAEVVATLGHHSVTGIVRTGNSEYCTEAVMAKLD